MTFENFKKILDGRKKSSELYSKLYDLGIDIINWESPNTETISILLEEYYTKDGADWIDWYVYEKDGREDMKAWEADGTEICTDDKSLWEYVENIRKEAQ